MALRDFISEFGNNILKEGKHTRFRNERKRFAEFVDTVATRFPRAVSADHALNEPYRSLVFLVTIGQRPVTSLLILEIMLRTKQKPLKGKEIGEKLAEKLKIPLELTTKGGNYKDRVGDLISTFVKIGILEPVLSDQSGHLKEQGFRIKESAVTQVEAFIDSIRLEHGLLGSLEPLDLEDLFKVRFNQKVKYVIKSGSGEKQQFSIGKIIKSMMNPRLGLTFESAIGIIKEIEPKFMTGMKTLAIKSILYNALEKFDKKIAENYRQIYPEIFSMTMSNGEVEAVNYSLVKALINKEAKLKLTRNLQDKFASMVYNAITTNPKEYQRETAVREYINALIHSEGMHVRSGGRFLRNHLDKAISSLEGCRKVLLSNDTDSARDLFGGFLDQICLVTLALIGYLPFRNLEGNVDLISNLLRQEIVKEELENKFQLDKHDLSQIQRIRFMMQTKDTASRKSLEKLVYHSERLIDSCERMLRESSIQTRPESIAAKISDATPLQITTGFEDLDNLLLGGLPHNYAVILTSPSCDERDMLVTSFLEAGRKEGQITFHVTIDSSGVKTPIEELWSNFYLFICNPESGVFIDSLANVFKLRGVENLTDISIALNSAIRKLDRSLKSPRRICIEIISDILLQHHAVSTRRWLAAVIPTLKSRGFTILAVMNPHMHSAQEVHAVLGLFEGEIEIYKKKTQKGLKRFLRIEKMYNQEYLDTDILLKRRKTR